MRILFTVCGRAGSKGLKNKNLRDLSGVPLSFYALGAIRCFQERRPENEICVAVNTDSEHLKDIFRSQNTLPVTFVDRKEELTGDTVAKVAVIQDTFFQLADWKPELVIDLDITSPYRRPEDLVNIVDVYSGGDYDLVFSVVPARRSPYFNMVEKKEDGYYRKISQSSFTTRQQTPKSYEMNASIYAYDPAFLGGRIEKTILDYRCGISVMPDFLVLDIDSEEDYEMMQYLHDYYCRRDPGLLEVFQTARSIALSRNDPALS